MENFEEFKQELIEKCKSKNACNYGLEELEYCNSYEDFDYLDGDLMDWAVSHLKLEFLEKVPFEKLDLSIDCLIKLILFHPKFSYLIEDWNELYDYHWSRLLSKQPQFAEFCDWENLNGDDWTYLLSRQPQFADFCDWDKLNGRNWSRLLSRQPQFADFCDWEKLSEYEWELLLRYRPQFKKYRKDE